MNESERGRPGERGPKGDHGQQGDTGLTGDTGDEGARGRRGHLGEPGNVGPRGQRGSANLVGYLLMGVAVAIAFWVYDARVNILEDATVATKIATMNLKRETTERRGQACKLFESQHLEEVNHLKRTYKYLGTLPRKQYGTFLIKAIVAQLPEIEKTARIDSAPEYCDEPGAKAEAKGAAPVGLPEPDPVLPKHRDFRYLLKR